MEGTKPSLYELLITTFEEDAKPFKNLIIKKDEILELERSAKKAEWRMEGNLTSSRSRPGSRVSYPMYTTSKSGSLSARGQKKSAFGRSKRNNGLFPKESTPRTCTAVREEIRDKGNLFGPEAIDAIAWNRRRFRVARSTRKDSEKVQLSKAEEKEMPLKNVEPEVNKLGDITCQREPSLFKVESSSSSSITCETGTSNSTGSSYVDLNKARDRSGVKVQVSKLATSVAKVNLQVDFVSSDDDRSPQRCSKITGLGSPTSGKRYKKRKPGNAKDSREKLDSERKRISSDKRLKGPKIESINWTKGKSVLTFNLSPEGTPEMPIIRTMVLPYPQAKYKHTAIQRHLCIECMVLLWIRTCPSRVFWRQPAGQSGMDRLQRANELFKVPTAGIVRVAFVTVSIMMFTSAVFIFFWIYFYFTFESISISQRVGYIILWAVCGTHVLLLGPLALFILCARVNRKLITRTTLVLFAILCVASLSPTPLLTNILSSRSQTREFVRQFYLQNRRVPFLMEFIQLEQHCCGVYNYADYYALKYDGEDNETYLHEKLPDSCCIKIKPGCQLLIADTNKAGCFAPHASRRDFLSMQLSHHGTTFLPVALIPIILPLLHFLEVYFLYDAFKCLEATAAPTKSKAKDKSSIRSKRGGGDDGLLASESLLSYRSRSVSASGSASFRGSESISPSRGQSVCSACSEVFSTTSFSARASSSKLPEAKVKESLKTLYKRFNFNTNQLRSAPDRSSMKNSVGVADASSESVMPSELYLDKKKELKVVSETDLVPRFSGIFVPEVIKKITNAGAKSGQKKEVKVDKASYNNNTVVANKLFAFLRKKNAKSEAVQVNEQDVRRGGTTSMICEETQTEPVEEVNEGIQVSEKIIDTFFNVKDGLMMRKVKRVKVKKEPPLRAEAVQTEGGQGLQEPDQLRPAPVKKDDDSLSTRKPANVEPKYTPKVEVMMAQNIQTKPQAVKVHEPSVKSRAGDEWRAQVNTSPWSNHERFQGSYEPSPEPQQIPDKTRTPDSTSKKSRLSEKLASMNRNPHLIKTTPSSKSNQKAKSTKSEKYTQIKFKKEEKSNENGREVVLDKLLKTLKKDSSTGKGKVNPNPEVNVTYTYTPSPAEKSDKSIKHDQKAERSRHRSSEGSHRYSYPPPMPPPPPITQQFFPGTFPFPVPPYGYPPGAHHGHHHEAHHHSPHHHHETHHHHEHHHDAHHGHHHEPHHSHHGHHHEAHHVHHGHHETQHGHHAHHTHHATHHGHHHH